MQYLKMKKTILLNNEIIQIILLYKKIKIIRDKKSIEANKNLFLDIYIKGIHRSKYNKTV